MAADEGAPESAPAASRWRLLIRHRFGFQAGLDAVAWSAAIVLATLLRYDLDYGEIAWERLALLIPIAVAIHVVVGIAGGLYLGRWRFGSFEEVAALTRCVVVTTVSVAFVNRFLFDYLIPVTATILAGCLALLFMAGARYTWRLVLERRMRPSEETAVRVLVFGAGEGGLQVINAMLRNPSSPYLPVALLDDHPYKQHLRINGVPVGGDRTRLADVARTYDASAIVIAIPSASASLIAELSELATAAGLDVMVLPPVRELFGSDVGVGDIRPISESDLLGRHEVDTDVSSISSSVTGRRVLVTGAGGSIGSELCAQLYLFAPDQLIMLDRDESALHAVQLNIEGRALLDSPNLVVADLRDRERLDRIFAEHRPEVVFHAAALKHLSLLERHPTEAVKTNVLGTQNLLELALAHGVDRFVNVSTDKAADPGSVLGYTKRLAERLTAAAASEAPGPYLSVRFGNVLNSRGSAMGVFEAQVRAGGPITVTDPDVTRYFMTVEEAVQLIIQAGAIGHGGEALVLDMGEPVRIADIAARMAARSDRNIEIVFTGLRPGEKLHEVLIGEDEHPSASAHPMISQVRVEPLDVSALDCLGGLDGEELIERLAELCRSGEQARPQPDLS
ncbi:MAG: polysaccharide biosynthesis protein [Acidimicrobiales bacterium]|nr:polysaccharide biosynthesis protein [Acidimicrobiales bacterium]MCB1014223.1 polysaccharide biosynthesis protein [Acidimicrobiales bacterium]